MKSIQFNRGCSALLFCLLLAAASCKKDNHDACGGVPTITTVSPTTDRTDTLTTGNLSDWIIIQGTNLCGATKILFNDVEDSLPAAYITSTEITLAIPRGVPVKTNNLITVVTPGGTVTYPFVVSIPALVVTGMNNEYTPAGGEMVILGHNFDLYGVNPDKGKLLFGTQEVSIDRYTPDSVFATVPSGLADGTTLQIKDANGVVYPVPGEYRDPRGIVFNYDPYVGWNTGLVISDGPVPAPISGNYALLQGTYNAWDWNENYHTLGNFTLADLGVTGPVNQYNIKFEINVMNQWTVDPANAYNYTPLKFTMGLSNTLTYEYDWAPMLNGAFTTNGWKTITIPLETLVFNGASMPDINGALATGTTFMRFFIHGGYAMTLDMAWDNFRIVPKDH